MPALPRLSVSHFRPEPLFVPRSVAVIGADTPAGQRVLANLHQGGFPGAILPAADAATLPEAPDLAVICLADAPLAPTFAALAARGCFAAIVTGPQTGLRDLAIAHGVRSLGPGSFGLAIPGLRLNATLSHLPPPPGRLAVVSQSAALCRALIDWAEPNGVGFSYIVGIGGNDEMGFALVLDWLSQDRTTGAILLDIRRIRDPRAFLSAARTRPVVAIRAGSRLFDPDGSADAAFEAALRRAGVLCVATLEDLLAAAETLTRAPPPRTEALAIATNAIGPAQLAADAALRQGLALAALAPETRDVLRLAIPRAFVSHGGAEVPRGVGDIVYAGMEQPAKLAEACALLAGAREAGGVLVVHAPTGEGDAIAIAALAAGAVGLRVPVLACVMGETTGAAHRRLLADAGVPVFATPEQAVRAFWHLVQHRRNRAAAAELPPRHVLSLRPDRARVEAALAAADGPALAAAYGIAVPPPLHLTLSQDAMFGPIIGIAGAIDLPPLNLPLARAMLARAEIADPEDTAADALVRLSQLAIDCPSVASLTTDGALTLFPPNTPPPRLALPPYPADLTEHFNQAGTTFTLRPIRPEDAEAHGAFFARLSPEDIRRRFFSSLRELSREQTARMTQIDYDREMAFIAVRDDTAETVGVARLVRDTLTGEGEFAVIVQADMKGRGIAGRLMRALIAWARTIGLHAIVGQILADNQPMLRFIRHLGFTLQRVADEPDVMEARLELAAEPS